MPDTPSKPHLHASIPPASDISPALTTSAYSANPGRRVTPVRPKERTTTQTLASTVSSLSRHASSGLSSLSSAAVAARGLTSSKKTWISARRPTCETGSQPAHVASEVPDELSSSPSPIFEAMGVNRPEVSAHQDTFSHQLSDLREFWASKEHVTWAQLDWLPSGAVAATTKRGLFIAYAGGGLQIYALGSSSDILSECLNFQQILLPDDTIAGRVLCAKVQKLDSGKCRLVFVTEGANGNFILSTCSLASQMVDTTTSLTAMPISPATNPRHASVSACMQLNHCYIVIAQSHPPALHVLDAETLTAVRPVIEDVANASSSTSSTLPPPFHLSAGLLVYATTRASEMDNVLDLSGKSVPTQLQTPSPSVTKPFSAGVEQPRMTQEQMRVTAIEVGAQASDMAKRLGGGLVTGVRNLGEWGSHYAGVSGVKTTLPHHTRSPSMSALTNASHASYSTTSPCFTHKSVNSQTRADDISRRHETDLASDLVVFPAANTVRVVALSANTSVTEFKASRHNVALVKMDPSGRLVLVADSLGHSFNIFEILPRPKCLNTEPPPPALHRFKLLRGVTSAHSCDAFWSAESKTVGILTQTGTVHLFSLGPLHGPRARPIGITMTSFARVTRPALTERPGISFKGQPGTCFPYEERSFPLSAPPTTACIDGRDIVGTSMGGRGGESSCTHWLDVLTFHPNSAALALVRVIPASETSLDSTRETFAAASGAAAATATDRVSGLTAMMRRRSHTGAIIETLTSPAVAGKYVRQRAAHGSCKVIAMWTDLARTGDAPEVRHISWHPAHGQSKGTSQRPPCAWVSQAEIQTYDRTPRALVRPIYISHQFHFRSWRHSPNASLRSEPVLMDTSRAATDSLETMETVRVVPRDDDETMSTSISDFGASLASAMAAAGFDPVDYGSSPSSRIPSFPQGQPAKRPNWRTSVANGMSIPARLSAAASREVAGLRAMRPSPNRGLRSDVDRALSFDRDVSYDSYLFADARAAQPSPNGEAAISIGSKSHSLGRRDGAGSYSSTRGASLSPFARMIVEATSSPGGASSVETSPTTASDEGCPGPNQRDLTFDDDDDLKASSGDQGLWAAARGMQEDVEGDALGWDSFADAEFRGTKAQGQRRQGGLPGAGEDFVVGGLTLDDDIDAGSTTTSSEALPPFSRKNDFISTTARGGVPSPPVTSSIVIPATVTGARSMTVGHGTTHSAVNTPETSSSGGAATAPSSSSYQGSRRRGQC